MQPTDLVRTFSDSAHLSYVERRGIAADDGFWLQNIIECGEETQFLFHVLDHRFDHQVTVGKIGQLECPMQACAVLIHLSLGKLPFACQHIPGVVDTCHTLVEQLLVYFAHNRLVTRLCTGLCDTSAHQATTYDAYLANRHICCSLFLKLQKRNILSRWQTALRSFINPSKDRLYHFSPSCFAAAVMRAFCGLAGRLLMLRHDYLRSMAFFNRGKDGFFPLSVLVRRIRRLS